LRESIHTKRTHPPFLASNVTRNKDFNRFDPPVNEHIYGSHGPFRDDLYHINGDFP
jgi:hypothetical protein